MVKTWWGGSVTLVNDVSLEQARFIRAVLEGRVPIQTDNAEER